jgi:signal transduction histidine kinase
MQNLQELPEPQEAISKQLDALRQHIALSLPHELRTPLNTILGFSRFLISHDSEQWPEEEEMFEIQSAIYHSALRLQRLIDNYLLYANLRLVENDFEKRRRDVWQSRDLLATDAVIAPIVLFTAKKFNRQDDLKLTLSEADIHFSRKGLQKIIEELLDNTLKFSEPGTPVHLVTSIHERRWRLSIIDCGCGMSAEQIDNIEAFAQFERKRYDQQGTTGLGLAISRLLAQMNASELHIESRPEQGTKVTLEVPEVS